MPASIKTSANFFSRETFSSWDPVTDTFTGSYVGRKKRIDAFVSLWHRSTRRMHLYFRPEEAIEGAIALRHDNSGEIYILSETVENDYWVNDLHYVKMARTHRVTPSSGGKAAFYPVRTQGGGDDLGPVVIGPAQVGWADTELRSTRKSEDAEEVAIAEYFLAYSRNFSAIEGDFIQVNGADYRLMELHSDSGYRYARTSQESPKFKTVEFKIPSSTPAVFDPVTGTMTGGTEVTREVSALFGQRAISGRTPEHETQEQMTLFIYLSHIGFEPQLGHSLMWQGRRYRILSVEQRIEEKQLKLEVSP